MRHVKNIILSALVFIIVISCDESFDPKDEYVQEYIVNAVIRCDTTAQFIYIQTNYNPPAYDPNEFSGNTFIPGASVSVIYRDSIYMFTESTFTIENNERISAEAPYYINLNLSPEPGETLFLDIILADGTKLTSTTKTPRFTNLRFDKSSDIYIPPSDGFLDIEWEITDGDKFRQVYLPEVKIAYYKLEGDEKIYDEKTIPLNYIDRRGELVPNYPLPNTHSDMHYDSDAITRTMELISEGDPNKENYIILGAVFQLSLLDDNLVPYYMSTETFLGGYSIILDQLDYTNIEGGRGIFGSFFTNRSFTIRIDELYINQFGYRHE